MKFHALRNESVPYLATILLGACGWGMVHMTDQITAAPSIAYCLHQHPPDAFVVSIENLSLDERFEDIEFTLASTDSAFVFTAVDIVGTPPAFHGGSRPRITDDNASVKLRIPNLHPGSRFNAAVHYEGTGQLTFTLSSSMQPVRLWRCSWPVWLLTHRFIVLSCFSLLVIIVALLLVTLSHSSSRRVE